MLEDHFTLMHKNTNFNCGIQFTKCDRIINLNDFKYGGGHKILMFEIMNFLNVKKL